MAPRAPERSTAARTAPTKPDTSTFEIEPLKTTTGTAIAVSSGMTRVMPNRGLALLMFAGLLDLATTLYWHSKGMMTEMNPLMRPFLEGGVLGFAAIKFVTLAALWLAVVLYSDRNPNFCRKACTLGAAGYVVLWTTWTAIGNGLI
jgi:hypothetical protein